MSSGPIKQTLLRRDYQELSRVRLREARLLLRNRQYSGAYYFSGFGVECAIKAVIAKNAVKDQFPLKNGQKYYIHELSTLVALSRLDLDSQLKQDRLFEQNWAIVKDWNSDKRYSIVTKAEATSMFSAITSRQHGVMRWLRQNW